MTQRRITRMDRKRRSPNITDKPRRNIISAFQYRFVAGLGVFCIVALIAFSYRFATDEIEHRAEIAKFEADAGIIAEYIQMFVDRDRATSKPDEIDRQYDDVRI